MMFANEAELFDRERIIKVTASYQQPGTSGKGAPESLGPFTKIHHKPASSVS